MRGIAFEYSAPVSDAAPPRMDVACFIGFVSSHRSEPLPASLRRWWRESGFAGKGLDVINRPVPVESWEAFTAIFDDQRMTHQAQVHSRTLRDPLPISAEDARLHLIVDRSVYDIEMTPGGATVSLASLAEQLNTQFRAQLNGQVEARLESGPGFGRLVLRRTALQAAGELTVYANQSLGFPKTLQDDDARQENYLAAAVRAFFRQGGRKCYVISMGAPLPFVSHAADRYKKAVQLFWGDALNDRLGSAGALRLEDLRTIYLPGLVDDTQDIAPRQSLTYLMDLTDVTYLCFPDLVELFVRDIATIEKRPRQAQPEVFVACSREETTGPWFYLKPLLAPRISTTGYRVWKRFIDRALGFLDRHAPNTQLIAALPLPDAEAELDFEAFVLAQILGNRTRADDVYRRLQLVFPWLKTDMSSTLPESAEPAEGALLGLLAFGALTRGAYRSIAGALIDQAYDLQPLHSDADAYRGDSDSPFFKRICFFDFVPSGIAIQSDVTAVAGPTYRYAVIRRIMMLIHKAAHAIGLNYAFETSSQRVWKSIEDALSDLLLQIYQKHGLRGPTPEDAFSVVCDRSTMTQQDIDNGRFIVNISLQPAVPIERITVNMMIDHSGLAQMG
jgi:hypothetical protein